ncbi:hypothetical protein COV11_01575 [Candidatus Woesearchaeota archaeon CG10_big_fil_rev_8_21_14_0_10_30_7]|nr:MAG: hypothetical protein COV11_01575 [Candidatus Woesearchaeota archaeon CG10_big_fil_rev_8_21_14_0_10_30_7]
MEILLLILIIIASLALLLKSADYIILGISRYAKTLGLSDAIIGLLVVSMAASLPEIIASLSGLIVGNMDIAAGALIGTNMVHLALVVGVLSIVGKKMDLSCEVLDKSKLLIFGLFIIPFIVMSDGILSRPDGLLLIGSFVIYVIYLWNKEGTLGKIKKKVKLKHIWKDVLIFIGGLIALLMAGRILVYGVVNLSVALRISTYFITLIIIGIGSALPDFVVGLQSVLKKHQEIGVGDFLGSTMIQFLLYLGIISLIQPLTIDVKNILIAGVFLITSMGVLLLFLNKKVITWKHGLVLVGIYLLFIISQWFV